MTGVVKIAISLPERLLRIVDEQARERGLSRSELFRHAVESLFRREREEEEVREYVEGYLRQPETETEVEAMFRAGLPGMAQEPWE
ncbi:MAG: ribbon-helix-helix domain-containing protein [Actinomycetota bacterium]